MSDYRTLNRTVLAKVETTPGTDAAPTVGADAIRVEDPKWSSGLQVINTNGVTGSLDPDAPVPGGGPGNWSGAYNLKGSGAGGTAPEWGALLQGCGMAVTTLAADLTGTAQAGAAGSITLAAGASGVAIGMVITLTGGAGSGQTRVVSAWNNTTKVATVHPNWTVTPDATSAYKVYACVVYAPASQDLARLTIYDYLHNASAAVNSRLSKLVGAAGNCQLTFPNAGLVKADFNFQGQFVAPADVAHPGAATYDSSRPVAFMGADVSLDGAVAKFNRLSLDLGNEIKAADDPTATFGYAAAAITRRRITGRINPPVALKSVRDVFADFLAGSTRKLWTRYGTAGNGISAFLPAIAYTGAEDEDLDGLAYEGIPFAAQGSDTGAYLCVY